MEKKTKEIQGPEDLEKTLKIMEVVETELEAQKREVTFCLIVFLCALNVWSLLVAFWDYLGRPLKGETMTLGVELIAVLMLIVILKFTKLDVRRMGVTKKNLKSSLIRSCLISLGCIVALCTVKHFLNPEAPLVNWSLFDPWYVFTCFFQEFLARGFLVTTLVNITSTSRYSKHIAVITSSLLFMSLHSYYGFFFMIGACVLSFGLGYVYLRDENIWGVSIIHYAIGMVGILLELV